MDVPQEKAKLYSMAVINHGKSVSDTSYCKSLVTKTNFS